MIKQVERRVGGCFAILLLPLAIPTILLIELGAALGLIKKSVDLTPSDVLDYLDHFLNGGGGEWDWDDFTSIPITDPGLEGIRQEAAALDLPLTDEGETELRELLARARMLAATCGGVKPA